MLFSIYYKLMNLDYVLSQNNYDQAKDIQSAF